MEKGNKMTGKETSFLDTKNKEISVHAEEISKRLYPHEAIIITKYRVSKTYIEFFIPYEIAD